MKIAYIAERYPCLSESFVDAKIRGLVGCGDEVIVFAMRRDSSVEIPNGVKVVYKKGMSAVGLRDFLCFLKTVLSVFKECRREGIRLLKNFGAVMFFAGEVRNNGVEFIYCGFLSWPGLMGVAVSNITGVRMGIAAHARDVFVESGALNIKAKKAGFITVCNADAMESLKGRLDEKYHKKIHLNYHTQKNNYNSYKIICVGRLVEKKGVDVAVRAIGALLKERRDIELWIVGDGVERKKIERLIKKLGIGNKVFMAGALSRSITKALIKEADVLVFSGIIGSDSDRDGIVNVIIEAMALGTTVVASDIKSLEDIVVDGETGLVFEKKNVKKLATAVNKLIGSYALREKVIKNGRKLVKEKFGEENILGITKLIKKSYE